MFNPWLFIKSEWRASRGIILALTCLLALSVSVGAGLRFIERDIRAAMKRAGESASILIGAKGSSVQLFLSTAMLQAEALPLMHGNPLASIAAQENVAWYAPIALGDSYKQKPIIGTTTAFLHKGKQNALAEGRFFAATNEAVVGSAVAAELGLSVGSRFAPMHGMIAVEEESHGKEYTVVGVLNPTHTPHDAAIFVPVEAVWQTHGLGHGETGASGKTGETGASDKTGISSQENAREEAESSKLQNSDTEHSDTEHSSPEHNDAEYEGQPIHEEDLPHWPALPGISALIVEPVNIAAAYKIRTAWNTDFTQAVFSGEVLTYLFSLLGEVGSLLQVVALAGQCIALAAMLFMVVLVLMLRKKALLLMRTLGAPSGYLAASVLVLLLAVLVLGCVLGVGLGWMLRLAAAGYMPL